MCRLDVNDRRWPRKVKAAIVEGQQGREGLGLVDQRRVKRALTVREEGLQETTQLMHEREECVERTCEGVIALTQSKEGGRFLVVGRLYQISRRQHAVDYVILYSVYGGKPASYT